MLCYYFIIATSSHAHELIYDCFLRVYIEKGGVVTVRVYGVKYEGIIVLIILWRVKKNVQYA